MNDMDMIFLFSGYLERTDLSFLEGADRKEEEEQEEDQDE